MMGRSILTLGSICGSALLSGNLVRSMLLHKPNVSLGDERGNMIAVQNYSEHLDRYNSKAKIPQDLQV